VPWIAIDTETTGREAGEHRIVEIGCVLFERGIARERHSWLLDPECPIPEEAIAVHGITDADVLGKPTFAAVASEVAAVLGRGVPLAYNAEFDQAFLHAEFVRLGGSELMPVKRSTVWLDPLSWARELQKEHKSRALGEVCERLGIQLERAHRATDDDGAVLQRRQRSSDGRSPRRITRVSLEWHPRVVDVVPVAERPRQAVDQLVVPVIVRPFAAALDEQDLPCVRHPMLLPSGRAGLLTLPCDG